MHAANRGRTRPRTVAATVLGPALLATTVLPFVAAPSAAATDPEALEAKIDVLARELAELREQMAIPETDAELTGAFGLGPAASKVYGVSQGISVGGYGEFYFAAPLEDTDVTGATNVADFYRFITYFGYKFSDDIVMNTEIEFEHGGDEVSVEFAYLDFLLDPHFNVRAGNLLVPMGFLNRMHEPAFYRGNFRPEIERRILPSTWHEMGIGAHGILTEGLRYDAYLLNGLDASSFDAKGIRGGRQGAGEVMWEDVAGVVAVQYEHPSRSTLSGSFFYGGADQGQLMFGSEKVDVTHWIGEVHGELRWRQAAVRGLFVVSENDDAGDLSLLNGVTIPQRQIGWYLEASYDVAPQLLGPATGWQISPWVRYEDMDLQDEVADGFVADPTLAQQLLTVGLDLKPQPNVVLKLDYVHTSNDADTATSDEVRVGAGFVY